MTTHEPPDTDENGAEPEPGNEGNRDLEDEGGDETEEHTSSEDKDHRSESPATDQTINFILNAFHDAVTADGANFGVSTRGNTGEAPETGRIDSAVVSTTVERYAEPASYAEARQALVEDHMVVLEGARGRGKRTGAIVLLRDVLPADAPIVSLSPTATLKELAARLARRKSDEAQGYVVFDRLVTERGREADHQWEVLCGKVQETGKYLVITTWEEEHRPHESVRRIRWAHPEPARALRVHMGDAIAEEMIGEVVAALPAAYTMADLVAVAERMTNDGAVPDRAVAAVFDQSERRAVEEWFAKNPALPQILDITTLAFASRIGVRDFEDRQSRLHALLIEEQQPQADDAQADEATTAAPPTLQRRSERLFRHDLIRLEQVVVDGVPRKLLAFREDGYRRHVLEKLFEEYGIDFWNPVRRWLHEAVLEDAWRLRIASGLALLAHASFDEVMESYLTPWGSGIAGWKGRYAAASTLWFMCLDEELRPIALRTAVRWASYGSPQERLTAIVAFAGELGARYPTEASRRLWQLVEQPGDLSPVAAAAFGDLFASLASREGGGRQVVNHLSRQVGGLHRPGRNARLRRASLRAALAVVRARNPATGRPAIIEYICARPEEIPVVARMWAALLRHRPIRHDALTALHTGLLAMDRLTPAASDHARSLGNALGETLPATEHEALARDFAKRTRHRKHADRSAALAQILIKALERAGRKRRE
ncbi:hypothetical protein [Thermomonospora cellulosilytica]|uniref:Uncharacterized protein n=1 Tax=Thermomonospora cellulosilytica TaxID=1411118 RepID=A0A7W3MW51_9ACTN|nr:hypothetical protein [Thermomonospora cellulosilytica]MBA9002988.1 hypothetical protein [Thermomonospora cellulosilytica]